MAYLPSIWRPLTVEAIERELSGLDDWVLCSGHSVALIVGRDTRAHGDIDVGVFRSRLRDCLHTLGSERVFLCLRGVHCAWDGGNVPEEVHDIWIADQQREYWVLQIMVFDDDADRVYYRRDRRINWSKKSHAIEVNGIRVLNPFITVLFKVNKPALEDKEIHDIMQLIESKPTPITGTANRQR
jgi:hypothetical protein